MPITKALQFLALLLLTTFASCTTDSDTTIAPELILTDGTAQSYAVPATASIVKIKFTSTLSWSATVKDAPDWCTLSTDKGVAGMGQVLDVFLTDNEITENRTAIIIIKSKDIEQEIVITQKELDPTFTISGVPESPLAYTAGEFSIKVSENIGAPEVIIAPEAAEWLTLAPVSVGKNITQTTLTFRLTGNTTYSNRTAQITITSGGVPKTVAIEQLCDLQPLTLLTPSDANSAHTHANTTKAISFSTGYIWSASIRERNAGWCTISKASGMPGATEQFVITLAANHSIKRVANITILSGTTTQTITVTQGHKYVEVEYKETSFMVYDRNMGEDVPTPAQVPTALNWVNSDNYTNNEPENLKFKGDYYTIDNYHCPDGWRLPTKWEADAMASAMKRGTATDGAEAPPAGQERKFTSYIENNGNKCYFPYSGKGDAPTHRYGHFLTSTTRDSGDTVYVLGTYWMRTITLLKDVNLPVSVRCIRNLP